MPFAIPTLEDWRKRSRDYVVAKLPVRAVLLPKSPLRVMSDNSGSLSFEMLLYLQWVTDQLLPDTAEAEWLDRHAAIWLPGNGRKSATFSSGSATASGIASTVIPKGSIWTGKSGNGAVVQYQTTADATLGAGLTPIQLIAITPGAVGNLASGAPISLAVAIAGVTASATAVTLTGGTDEETDDELRARILLRIRQPPMGGDADDYVSWALQYPGVTRAWSSPLEMGPGTVTVRFMMDKLRATMNRMTNGFPLPSDIAAVQAFLDAKRPVAVKDFFVSGPIPEPVSFAVSGLPSDDASTRAAIRSKVIAMLLAQAAPARALNGIRQPAQTIYAAWVNDAIYSTAGASYFDLTMSDHVMPNNGSMGVLGQITFA